MVVGLLPICLSMEAYGQKSSEANLAANKALVRRFFEEVLNQNKPELLREVVAADYHFISLEDGTEGRGIEQLEKFIPHLHKGIPDIHYTVDQIVAEGDKVVLQVTVNGTHKDEFGGYPASNNKIKKSEVFFYTVKNDKITECRRLIDLYHLYKQLGGEK